VLWRTEPAPALVLYFLLAAATGRYLHVVGPHFNSGLGSLHTLARRDASSAGLVVYAFFTWRIWLGSAVAWSLSLMWQLLLLVVTVNACWRTPDPALFGLVALTLASLVPLFAWAVLDRVSRRVEHKTLRAMRRAFREGYAQPRRRPKRLGA
jgi:hypothetical protein